MPSRDISPPPAYKINALPPLMSHIDCLSLLLLLSIINKINIPTNLLLVSNDYNWHFSSLREVVYKSNSPRDPFYLKSPIPFIWSMASWLNWKLLQTVKENRTYTFLVRTNNLKKNIDCVEEVSILTRRRRIEIMTRPDCVSTFSPPSDWVTFLLSAKVTRWMW